MSSPFTTQFGREVLTSEMTDKSPVDLVVALFAAAIAFGIDRVELAIKATYPKDGASQIISGMNRMLAVMA